MGDPGHDRPILVLQHIGCEPPAAYGDELRSRGIRAHTVSPHEGEPLPDWRAYGGVIAMGGPMGTYEDHLHPWLTQEKRLIAQAVLDGRPFWGVCLGAQLLAASLGAHVGPGPGPEVGVLPVHLTPQAAADPVFAVAPETFQAFQMHGDTYELPPGAIPLARSELYEQQAFVFRRAYGVQFHIEVGADLVAEWGAVPAYASSLTALEREDPLGELLAAVARVQDASNLLARSLFSRWLERVAGFPADGS